MVFEDELQVTERPGWGQRLLVVLPLFLLGAGVQQDRLEESQDFFKRWLEHDVVYIISAQERGVFLKLTTADERNRFIEQFWRERDTDPSSNVNEFREEHYRRIAYANENFAAGKPGWKTDRGMIYIKFGSPDRRQTNPTGGRVYRTKLEIRASQHLSTERHVTALPYEIWEYRYLPGLGQEISFEFVSKDGSPEYQLALSPDEKDALFFNTGSHLVSGRDRNLGLKMLGGNPLDRVEALAAALRPLPTRPPQDFVSSQVHFSEMPFELESRILAGEAGRPLSEIEVAIPHSSLAFDRFGAQYRARVDLEIFVRDVRKIVVSHRAHQLESTVSKSELRGAISGNSRHQEFFSLAAGRYLIEVWIKDVQGGTASFDRLLVVVPNEVKPGNGKP